MYVVIDATDFPISLFFTCTPKRVLFILTKLNLGNFRPLFSLGYIEDGIIFKSIINSIWWLTTSNHLIACMRASEMAFRLTIAIGCLAGG